MRHARLCSFLAFLLAFVISTSTWAQSDPTTTASRPDSAPLYRVSFEKRDPVPGISATPAIALPFQCTGDGTILVRFVVPSTPGAPPRPNPMLDVSISQAGQGKTFPLDQVPGLYGPHELDRFAADSELVFLVQASRDDNSAKAPKHLYIVSFTREGEYKRTTEIEDEFQIQRLGEFPSGAFLAFGLNAKDSSPELELLKEDGTLLKSLQTPKGAMPESLLPAKDSPHPLRVSPTQFVAAGHSIRLVLNNTTFPVLEINESGAIRAIQPKLPAGEEIEYIIPSDTNLYVIGASGPPTKRTGGLIYEVNPEDGTLLRRFDVGGEWTASNVACVHDGKFLSIDYGEGKVVPLVGSPELATSK